MRQLGKREQLGDGTRCATLMPKVKKELNSEMKFLEGPWAFGVDLNPSSAAWWGPMSVDHSLFWGPAKPRCICPSHFSGNKAEREMARGRAGSIRMSFAKCIDSLRTDF